LFSLYAECFVVFGVFFVFLKPSSEGCMWDQFVGFVGGVGSTVFFLCKESSKCKWDQNIWVFPQEAWRGLLDDDDDRF
jgi:hypothetical protein